MEIIINNKKIIVYEYKSLFMKIKGLMGIKTPISYGIRLNRCNSIHTFFMKQKIDVCITDKENKILYLRQNLNKNKIIMPIKNGYYTYELPINTVKYLKVNNYLK